LPTLGRPTMAMVKLMEIGQVSGRLRAQ